MSASASEEKAESVQRPDDQTALVEPHHDDTKDISLPAAGAEEGGVLGHNEDRGGKEDADTQPTGGAGERLIDLPGVADEENVRSMESEAAKPHEDAPNNNAANDQSDSKNAPAAAVPLTSTELQSQRKIDGVVDQFGGLGIQSKEHQQLPDEHEATPIQEKSEPPLPSKERIASPRPPSRSTSDSPASAALGATSSSADLPFDFHRFLEQLRHRTADPVARYLRSFLSEFTKRPWQVHEQVKIIRDFLVFIATKMATCDVWKNVSESEFDNAKEGMEKLVMNRLYSQTFSPEIPLIDGIGPTGASSGTDSPLTGGKSGRRDGRRRRDAEGGRRGQHQEDVERDDILAQKIRIYAWIREQHLDIPVVGSHGKRFIELAQNELLKINGYRAPRDKIICILNCCKVIFAYLRNSRDADTSADSFIPLLIFIVIKANPDHLVSNLQYILRFRNQDKLTGEAGYYLSSLSGAIHFVETVDRTSLSVSDEEFERNVEAAVSAIAQHNRQREEEAAAFALATASANASPSPEPGAASRLGPRSRDSPLNTAGGRLPLRQHEHQPWQQSELQPDTDDSNREFPPSNDRNLETPVSGLLRSIQNPLSKLGRMFTEEPESSAVGMETMRHGYGAGEVPPRAERRPESRASQRGEVSVEYTNVIETLSNMFPNLDRDVIEDVVWAQNGRIGLAVDICLALSAEV